MYDCTYYLASEPIKSSNRAKNIFLYMLVLKSKDKLHIGLKNSTLNKIHKENDDQLFKKGRE